MGTNRAVLRLRIFLNKHSRLLHVIIKAHLHLEIKNLKGDNNIFQKMTIDKDMSLNSINKLKVSNINRGSNNFHINKNTNTNVEAQINL